MRSNTRRDHIWATAKVDALIKASTQRATAINDTLYWVDDWKEWVAVLRVSDICAVDGDWDDDDWDDDDWDEDDDFFDLL